MVSTAISLPQYSFSDWLNLNGRSVVLFQIIRWLLPLWSMAAMFDTENNECSQDDYIAPVFAVNDNSGVGKYLYPFLIFCFVHVYLFSMF